MSNRCCSLSVELLESLYGVCSHTVPLSNIRRYMTDLGIVVRIEHKVTAVRPSQTAVKTLEKVFVNSY